MAIFAPPLRRSLQESRDAAEDRAVRKDVRSANWDGGTDLSSVDTTATKGYFADYSAGAAQFETLFVNGTEIGTWAAWTPSYANLTVGNGTVKSRFTQIGKLVVAQFFFALGSSSSVGTSPTISTPVTASSDYLFPLNHVGGAVFDNTGTETLIGMVRLQTTTTFAPVSATASGNFMREDDLTSTNPFTWASGDHIIFTATFEAA